MTVAIVALNGKGLGLARRVQPVLSAAVHGLAGRAEGADVRFTDTVSHLRMLFAEGHAIVGVCAAGILIRALAPVLADKRTEPPVVALAEDGSVAVPLLGGHRGANRLAKRIANALGGTTAVTTAGDLGLGLALDDPPAGWTVANPERAKRLAAALLAGERVRLVVAAGDGSWPDPKPFSNEGDLSLLVTDRAVRHDETALVVHPPVLAVGVGCERGAAPAELEDLVRGALAKAGLAEGAVAAIGSLDLKADEPAVHDLAAALGRPARFFTAAELEAETPRLATPSDTVFREVGSHGVAESAALALAGSNAELIVPKRKSKRCTCAVARSISPIAAMIRGRPRGRLSIVGIGPGSADWRTPEATMALAEADAVVGYRLYLNLVGDLIGGKPRHGSDLGEEETRVRTALDLAASGARIALVCSGDPGIYALASLVFELLEREPLPDWSRIEVTVVPGISALQAAAARAGAPLGHDFCAISLSDLLTPRDAIVRRLKAAAAGDFVVALYNPQSGARRDLLPRAKEILASARPPGTPVIVARNLGRQDETLTLSTLRDFDPAPVDMLSLVVIGNSETSTTSAGRVFTPRGYGNKKVRQNVTAEKTEGAPE